MKIKIEHNQNLQDASKAVLRKKFIAINAYIIKEGRPQINNLTFHVKTLEREEQIKPKTSRREEMIKIKAESYK